MRPKLLPYSCFGITLLSPIDLHLPISSENGQDTVSIRTMAPACIPANTPMVALSEDGGQTEIFLNSPGVGRFVIRNGDNITIQPDIPAPGTPFYHFFLTGSVLSLLLYQRGNLVLHGSVVEIGGQAVAFLGHSGAGKSSIAAACVVQGSALLADDAVVIESNGERMSAVPGFPRLKVHQQTVDALQLRTDQLQDFLPRESEEYGLQVDGNFLNKKKPLAAIYLLGESENQESIESLGSASAFIELLPHVIPSRYGVDGGARMFGQLSDALKKIPVFSFLRPKESRRLHSHPEMVTKHLAGLKGIL